MHCCRGRHVDHLWRASVPQLIAHHRRRRAARRAENERAMTDVANQREVLEFVCLRCLLLAIVKSAVCSCVMSRMREVCVVRSKILEDVRSRTSGPLEWERKLSITHSSFPARLFFTERARFGRALSLLVTLRCNTQHTTRVWPYSSRSTCFGAAPHVLCAARSHFSPTIAPQSPSPRRMPEMMPLFFIQLLFGPATTHGLASRQSESDSSSESSRQSPSIFSLVNHLR